ncbi:genetic suppressor element 1-like [Lytechinus pictus]|uniref:genetic suppressor element 1-like n=1 Tax=Lytechinus pictus TaxID=7653 RepID=UPI0030BA1604
MCKASFYCDARIRVCHLPPGPSNKPPPLTVVSSANSKANRTTATVTPFSQSASTVTVTSGNGGAGTNQALAATRTSSFAAALRKLAKQANDNGPDEISPRTSPASTTRSSASTPSKYHLGPSPLVVPTSSPPVVTIAPTHTTSSALDSRRELERRSQSNSVDRSLGRSLSGEGASSIWRGKESPSLGLGPRRPLAQLPSKSEEMAGRGFQPYRAGEDPIRPPTATPHPLASYDPTAMAQISYPFHPAFLTPANLQYPAFRFVKDIFSFLL